MLHTTKSTTLKDNPTRVKTFQGDSLNMSLGDILSKDKSFETYVKCNDEMAAMLFDRNKNVIVSQDVDFVIKDESLKNHPSAQKMVNIFARMGIKDPEKYAMLNITKILSVTEIYQKYPKLRGLDKEVVKDIFKKAIDAIPRSLPATN